MTDELLTVRDGPVATVIFNRPARHNALTLAMRRALPEIVDSLEADPEVRVIVFRGAGTEAFASGADIGEFRTVRYDARSAAAYNQVVERAEARIAGCARPTIAMTFGYAVGGGLEVAVACDLRLAASDARFGITASKLGIIYGLTATARLVNLVGPAHAKDILYSGRIFGADEAATMGLVNRVLPPGELEGYAGDYARMLAANAPLSITFAKHIIHRALAGPSAEAARAVEELVARGFESEDYREGVAAFLEKRPPRFRGR
ncbi:MAG: enoyl-CoA hydratase/isomerase family protein [Armatimonadetes bacterium]|nr:enoyl-CoA hydratase/isomerase family protein [Armatimonadota bacterium]